MREPQLPKMAEEHQLHARKIAHRTWEVMYPERRKWEELDEETQKEWMELVLVVSESMAFCMLP